MFPLSAFPLTAAYHTVPAPDLALRPIREASTLLKPYSPELDVDVNESFTIADHGDIDTIPGYMEDSFAAITSSLKPFFASKTLPVILGGDHSISLANLRAVHAAHGPVALLHFDAHSDTIPSYYGKPYNHGTPFYWALKEGLILPQHSTQIGIRGRSTAATPLTGPASRACASSWGTRPTQWGWRL